MDRMGLDILGISETFWTGKGDFKYNLPNGKEFKIMYSGGEKRRKGVAVIVQGKLAKSVINYQAISERHITIKIESKPRNIFINQVYAPTSDSNDQEIEAFYDNIEDQIKLQKQWNYIVLVTGDFNAKVGEDKFKDICGPHGLGTLNKRGERLLDFCIKQNLMISNTWFQQKKSARSTWSEWNDTKPT